MHASKLKSAAILAVAVSALFALAACNRKTDSAGGASPSTGSPAPTGAAGEGSAMPPASAASSGS